MAPFWTQLLARVSNVAVATLFTPNELVSVTFPPAAIVASLVTLTKPLPKALLFPATTVPPLSVVPPV